MRASTLLSLIFLALTTALFAQAPPEAVLIAPPKYPPPARQAQIQGTVRVQLEVDANGNVEKVQVIKGHPMLAPVVAESVRKWEFQCRADNCLREFQMTFKFVISGRPGDAQPSITLELPETVVITVHPPVVETIRDPLPRRPDDSMKR